MSDSAAQECYRTDRGREIHVWPDVAPRDPLPDGAICQCGQVRFKKGVGADLTYKPEAKSDG